MRTFMSCNNKSCNQKDTFAPPTQLLGGACPGCPPKSTPMLPAVHFPAEPSHGGFFIKETDIYEVDVSEGDMTGVDMTGADITGAYLTRADFMGLFHRSRFCRETLFLGQVGYGKLTIRF